MTDPIKKEELPADAEVAEAIRKLRNVLRFAKPSCSDVIAVYGEPYESEACLPPLYTVSRKDFETLIRAATKPAPLDVEWWQPIETAPRDGTQILVYTALGFMETVQWDLYYQKFVDGHTEFEVEWLTHWMPLPNPPALDEVKKRLGGG